VANRLEEKIREIDIEGFKIRIDDLEKNDFMPEFFNSPLVGLWEITRACNLKCIQCYNNSGKKLPNELTHDEKINTAKQIVDAKIFRMCLSGGEPILCESFWDIAEILNRGHVLCNTITNGWLMNEDIVDNYIKNFKIIQVSVDGATPQVHDRCRGRKGSWERAINACKLITENGGRLSIAMCVSQINVKEVGKLLDLAYEIGAEEFRLDVARIIGQAALHQDVMTLTTEQLQEFEKNLSMKMKEYQKKNKKIKIQIAPKDLGSYIRSYVNIPPMVCYISPVGTCAPDPVIPYSGGSLKEKTLKEIWNEIKTCHKNKEFIKLTRMLKTGQDFVKLENIPYVRGELHDK
jgi:MoaA/NifB/PqqE/SkfB family radical SAM enzyme